MPRTAQRDKTVAPSPADPFLKVEDIVPSDTDELEYVARSLYIGGAGDIKVTTEGGSTSTLYAHPVGYLPGSVRKVFATGTTATNIRGLR